MSIVDVAKVAGIISLVACGGIYWAVENPSRAKGVKNKADDVSEALMDGAEALVDFAKDYAKE